MICVGLSDILYPRRKFVYCARVCARFCRCSHGHIILYADNVYVHYVDQRPIHVIAAAVYTSMRIPTAIQCC